MTEIRIQSTQALDDGGPGMTHAAIPPPAIGGSAATGGTAATGGSADRIADTLDAALVGQLDWTLGQMGLTRQTAADRGSTWIEIASSEPEAGESSTAGQGLTGTIAATTDAVVEWLLRARDVANGRGAGVFEGEPIGEPRTVSEIAAKLLAVYKAREGQVRFAGCTLEERPHLRLGWIDEQGQLSSRFFGADGAVLNESEVQQHGFSALRVHAPKLRRSDRGTVAAWTAVANAETERARLGAGCGSPPALVDVTVAWSRRAAGKIVVRFGPESNAQIAFDGWARDFAEGRQQPPKFRCPLSGLESYELIRLEDGTITVPEAVERCEISGAELLKSGMATCSMTGKRVDQRLLCRCGVTGRMALENSLVHCQCCGGLVSPGTVVGGICQLCKQPESLEHADPRLRDLVRREPDLVAGLGRGPWAGWVADARGVVLAGGFRQVKLIVFDPRNGKVLRTGIRNRLLGKWVIEPRP